MTNEGFGLSDDDLRYLARILGDMQRYAGPALQTLTQLAPQIQTAYAIAGDAGRYLASYQAAMTQLADVAAPSLVALAGSLHRSQDQIARWFQSLAEIPAEEVAEATQKAADIQADPASRHIIRRAVSGIRPEDIAKLKRDSLLLLAVLVVFYIVKSPVPVATREYDLTVVTLVVTIYMAWLATK